MKKNTFLFALLFTFGGLVNALTPTLGFSDNFTSGKSDGNKIRRNSVKTICSGIFSENKNKCAVTSGVFTHYIGEKFGGGVIFHVWKDAQGVEHGLIADKVDLSTEQVWSNLDKTLVGPSAQSLSDGLNNSKAIVAQEGHTESAAALCLNSTNGGQSDWYLPSIEELTLLWNSREIVNKTLGKMPKATKLNLQIAFYWSSTESEYGNANYFSFVHGFDDYANTKDSRYFVRAIRAF